MAGKAAMAVAERVVVKARWAWRVLDRSCHRVLEDDEAEAGRRRKMSHSWASRAVLVWEEEVTWVGRTVQYSGCAVMRGFGRLWFVRAVVSLVRKVAEFVWGLRERRWMVHCTRSWGDEVFAISMVLDSRTRNGARAIESQMCKATGLS